MYLIFGTEQQIEELRGKAGKALVHMIFKVICQKSRLRFFTKQFLFNKKKILFNFEQSKTKNSEYNLIFFVMHILAIMKFSTI